MKYHVCTPVVGSPACCTRGWGDTEGCRREPAAGIVMGLLGEMWWSWAWWSCTWWWSSGVDKPLSFPLCTMSISSGMSMKSETLAGMSMNSSSTMSMALCSDMSSAVCSPDITAGTAGTAGDKLAK